MNHIGRALSAMAFVALALSSSPATAGSAEDVAEAEALIVLENMLNDMVGRIYSRTDERAKQAIFGTENAEKIINSCKSSPTWLDIDSEHHLWMSCLMQKPTYRRVYSVLFSGYLEEELQREIALQAGQIPSLEESLRERLREQLTR